MLFSIFMTHTLSFKKHRKLGSIQVLLKVSFSLFQAHVDRFAEDSSDS